MTDIYEKLNDIQFADPIEEETLTKSEQDKFYKQFKAKTTHKKTSMVKRRAIQIAAAMMLLAGGLPLMNHDIQASAVKIVENITYSFKDIITPEATKYATHINETVSVDKLDAKLADVFINDKFLTYNLLLDASGKDTTHLADIISVKINGKEMMEGLSGSSEYLKDKKVTSDIGLIHLREAPPKGKLDVEMTFGSYEGNGENFGFKFKVDTTKLDRTVKSKEINKIVPVGNENIDLHQLSINPLSAQIKLSAKNDNNYDINLYDEHGKKYYFNVIETKKLDENSESILVFNQDVGSTGKIDDLYKAKVLSFEIIDNGKNHNGTMKTENKTDKKALQLEL
ncbi:hypothetical protein ACMGE6_02795 [Macrococcus equi]|uniref:hypothetical protein n=1 Tax=Macrococcus equi TaxID=3395462 RepID=UPI0039BE971B